MSTLFKKTLLSLSLILSLLSLNGCVGGAPNYGERDSEEELTAEHR